MAVSSALSLAQAAALAPVRTGFRAWQWGVDKALSPRPPPEESLTSSPAEAPRIAVVGAGITGVTAAAHCVGHGFDVVIFEAGDEESLGGIWSRVNDSSSLQIHAATYRFHPSVRWDTEYPKKGVIRDQVAQLWRRYRLPERTVFGCRVERVARAADGDGRWVVNGGEHGRFDGVVAAVGTCGDAKKPRFDGSESFTGEVYHSSELTGKSPKNKSVVIVGGGASAVEALEFAVAGGASRVSILARSDKWIIPRNVLVDVLLSLNILGRETALSRVAEGLLRRLFYRDLAQGVAPPPGGPGLFTDTPMVNSDVLECIRTGRAEWVKCDVAGMDERGVVVRLKEGGARRDKDEAEWSDQGEKRRQHEGTETVQADMVVLATGFSRPSLDFLPADCFERPYDAPNWYLQAFPPPHPSVAAINCTYVSGIGTVGNWHIGIYTRILLMFLSDPLTRPGAAWMRAWVGMTRLLKTGSPVPALAFFTYLELLWWFAFCLLFNPFRWKWAVFVLFGLGMGVPEGVAMAEGGVLGRRKGGGRDEGRSV